jgi:hypothetical protein
MKPDTLNTKEITLEKIKIAIVERVSNRLLNAIVECSEADSFIANSIDMRLQGYIWGETGKTETIKYPATWRDAFKERWFPKWLARRYPVNYRVHEIAIRTLYPNFKISMPREVHVLKWQTLTYETEARAFASYLKPNAPPKSDRPNPAT